MRHTQVLSCTTVRAVLFAAALAAVTFPRVAVADPPIPQSNEDAQQRGVEPQAKGPQATAHTEVDPVPLIGGDSDVGWGGGAVVEIARREQGKTLDLWSLEAAGMITFKPPSSQGGPVQIPYQDYYTLLRLPQLVPGVMRLEIRPSFTEESTQKFYGFGNASRLTTSSNPEDPSYEYQRIHPTLVVRARLKLAGKFFALVGNSFTYNALSVPGTTVLAEQQKSGTFEEKQLIGSFAHHAVDLFEYAVVYDSRDNEVEPQSGMWHQMKIRLSPGGGGIMPYRYGQGNVTLRGYVTPVKRRLTFAARVVADWQFGDVPFYELARYEDTFALGGVDGVRGVPAQRYYGKDKLFANLEARAALFDFRALKKQFRVGMAAFFDAGRLWADGFEQPSLDGTGIGLKYGAGGGLRLRQGDALVIRFDVAWSPDASPVSLYFAAGEIF